MLIELTVVPAAPGPPRDVGDLLDEVRASGLHFERTPHGACVEGCWDDLQQVVERCRARLGDERVQMLLRVADDPAIERERPLTTDGRAD